MSLTGDGIGIERGQGHSTRVFGREGAGIGIEGFCLNNVKMYESLLLSERYVLVYFLFQGNVSQSSLYLIMVLFNHQAMTTNY